MVESPEELRTILKICYQENLRHFILGAGSNVLFSDAGFRGAVIKLGSNFKKIEQTGPTTIKAGGAAISVRLMNMATQLGLSGLECLCGFPSTVGGAVFMNAGIKGATIGQVVKHICYMSVDGLYGRLEGDEISLEVRKFSGLPEG
ncbi:MAG: FAD-binding protein, partial [Candidatus Adiutrix sp.]